MTFIIYAPNVHRGGGRSLLLALLEAIKDREDSIAVVDARLVVPQDIPPSRIAATVAPTVPARLAAEWRLRSDVMSTDIVLCFGNLPPLFGVRGRVIVYIQNRYLLKRREMADLPLRDRMRIRVERIWLKSRISTVDAVIVQSHSMQAEVEDELGVHPLVLPFAAARFQDVPSGIGPEGQRDFDFLYIASGEPHKNHETLIRAWTLLAGDGLYPTLGLTVAPSQYPDLCVHIEGATARHRLKITNVGDAATETIESLYRRSSALIYPSMFESFGLPLLEGRAAGLPIVASERDYVRDLVDPEETFDPDSPLSIARAVKRFLGIAENQLCVRRPRQFVEELLDMFGSANTRSSPTLP